MIKRKGVVDPYNHESKRMRDIPHAKNVIEKNLEKEGTRYPHTFLSLTILTNLSHHGPSEKNQVHLQQCVNYQTIQN